MSQLITTPIEIRINNCNFVPAKTLSKIVNIVDEAILGVELQELAIIKEEFNSLPKIIFDAVELKIKSKKGNNLIINDASKGSIVLGGFSLGLCVWILNKTIGETFKQAWIETEFHDKLKKFLLIKLDRKKERIGNEIKRNLGRNKVEGGVEVTEKVTVYISHSEDEEIIEALKNTEPDCEVDPSSNFPTNEDD